MFMFKQHYHRKNQKTIQWYIIENGNAPNLNQNANQNANLVLTSANQNANIALICANQN